MSAMFSSLGVRNYRVWFAGALVSNIGTWMQRIAQDWLVLTELTDDDASAVGIAVGLQFAPMLLLLPVTGMVADRLDRRKVLAVTQSTMAVLGGGLGVITLTGHVTLWMVYSFALLLGIAAAFDAPARQAFVGQLVPDAQLANAVGLNSASFNGARLIGPGIAGLLIAAIGPGWVFLANVLTFAAVLVALAALRPGDLIPLERARRGRGAIREGLRYVRGRRDLILVLVLVFLWGTFGMNFAIFISTMTRIVFELGPTHYGVLSSVLAIGSVSGALLSARRAEPRLGIIAWAALGAAASLSVAALAPNPWVFGVALVAVGVGAMSLMTTANSYVQITTPPAMRGRVMALYMAVFVGGTPIGAPLMGVIAQTAGPRVALFAAAAAALVIVVIAVAYFLRTRALRIRWEPQRRWPLRFTGRPSEDREFATTELAIAEAETRKI
ncbi:MAG TPA: MFS transporter [Pseudolysinimonas sp.]|nr:MFS transporter [Pseudolysinimonas sp.]